MCHCSVQANRVQSRHLAHDLALHCFHLTQVHVKVSRVFKMAASGIEIHPLDGGNKVEVPESKMSIGRGPFLQVCGVAD